MRFMVMVRANSDSESGCMPDEKLFAEMGQFNEELMKAGVMLAAEGLQPSSTGARVKFSGRNRTVVDGPFAEAKELIAGYWIWQVKSKDEAIDWLKRCPAPFGPGKEGIIELRQIYEADDFAPELSAKLRDQEERLREQMAVTK